MIDEQASDAPEDSKPRAFESARHEPFVANPLVSICIPCFNRRDRLERAVRSALAQDHERVEVIVSDNGSTDGTPELLGELAAEDERVVVRLGVRNLGPIPNLNKVRSMATGSYLMWLGDDDWLEPNYVGTCLRMLQEDPTLSMACGSVRYHLTDAGDDFDGRFLVADATTPENRVVQYWEQVKDNGSFYGLMPRDVSNRIIELSRHTGNDLHFVAAAAWLGGLAATRETVVHRDTGGATRSLKNVAEVGNLSWWEGEFPQLAIAWYAFCDVAWRSPVYHSASVAKRYHLGLRSAWIILKRFIPEAAPKYLLLVYRRLRGALSGRQ